MISSILKLTFHLAVGFILSFFCMFSAAALLALVIPQNPLGEIDLTPPYLFWPVTGLIAAQVFALLRLFKIKTKLVKNQNLYQLLVAFSSSLIFWNWYSHLTWWMWD